MRSRNPELNTNWGTICTPLAMLAADGKMRKIQTSNAARVQLEKTTGKKVISNKNAKSIKPPDNKKLDK